MLMKKGVFMNQVRQAVNVERAHRRGIRGQGITAAILDTGMCRHPDFQKRIIYFKDFVRGREECYDDASHGTHVTGILGGDGSSLGGKYCGIAPECGLIHLKVLDRMGQGQIEHIIRAIQWIIDNQEHYDIRIMNLSAGADKGEEDTVSLRLVEWVEKAWDAGITVVVAAGNLGPRPGSVTVPGNSKKVITVGAADGFYAFGTAGRGNYSGRGPTGQCICKPELVAPGTNIFSCSTLWRKGKPYAAKSGTSMAAPVVSGCAALLLSKYPQLTNVEVKMRLKESARDLRLPPNWQGWGMPDVERLLWPARETASFDPATGRP